MSIEKIKLHCQKIIPLVYDDSLSYYEFLMKVCVKINEMIEAIEDMDIAAQVKAYIESDDFISWFKEWIETEFQFDFEIPDIAWVTADSYNELKNKDTFGTFLSGLTTGIGLTAGTYTIDANTVLSIPVFIGDGVNITLAEGASITFKEGIVAGRFNIFGNVASGVKIYKTDVYPEWFGAKTDGSTDCASAIQDAVNACGFTGAVCLANGSYDGSTGSYLNDGIDNYIIGSTVSVKEHAVKIYATQRAVIFAKVANVFRFGSEDSFTELSGLENVFIYNMDGFEPASYANATVIFTNTARSFLNHCQFYGTSYALWAYENTSLEVRECECFLIKSTFTSGQAMTFGNPNASTSNGNVSTVVEGCALNSQGMTGNTSVKLTAIMVTGVDLRDIFIRNNDIAGFYDQIKIVNAGDGSALAYDIQLDGNILDNFAGDGVYIEKVYVAQLRVMGGYISGGAGAQSCIHVASGNNLLVTGVEFLGSIAANEKGIWIEASYPFSLTANSFMNVASPIVVDSGSGGITGNLFYAMKTAGTVAELENIVELTGSCTINMTNNNSISGSSDFVWSYAMRMSSTDAHAFCYDNTFPGLGYDVEASGYSAIQGSSQWPIYKTVESTVTVSAGSSATLLSGTPTNYAWVGSVIKNITPANRQYISVGYSDETYYAYNSSGSDISVTIKLIFINTSVA